MTDTNETHDVFVDPPASPESEVFVDAAREGRFMIRRCTSCGKAHWYPRQLCPFCFGPTDWEQASGRGQIYSYTIVAGKTDRTTIAYVTLAEGPTIMTRVVDCSPEEFAVGLPVMVTFKPSAGGIPVPCFRLASSPPQA